MTAHAVSPVENVFLDADRLRSTLEAILRFADFFGLDSAWIDRLRKMLADPATFSLVHAIVQYLLGLVGQTERVGRDAVRVRIDQSDVEISAGDFAEWLPLLFQLIRLIRSLRDA